MRRLYLLIPILFANLIACDLYASGKIPELSGNFIQGGLVTGKVSPGSKVIINDHRVRVSVNGEFIIGFGRDYPAKASLTVIQLDGSEYQHTLQIAQREYQIQHINGLPNALVNPDEKTLVRIQQERQSIAKARSLDAARMDFKTGFIWPAKGPITGVFGSQRILNGEPKQPHYGIDVATPAGTT